MKFSFIKAIDALNNAQNSADATRVFKTSCNLCIRTDCAGCKVKQLYNTQISKFEAINIQNGGVTAPKKREYNISPLQKERKSLLKSLSVKKKDSEVWTQIHDSFYNSNYGVAKRIMTENGLIKRGPNQDPLVKRISDFFKEV